MGQFCFLEPNFSGVPYNATRGLMGGASDNFEKWVSIFGKISLEMGSFWKIYP